MPDRTFVCRCEDITTDDCNSAIRDGYDCFEDLKRYLGVGTGPCQGKACVAATIGLLAQATGRDAASFDVMTFRPPVRPIPLGLLASQDAAPTDTAAEDESE